LALFDSNRTTMQSFSMMFSFCVVAASMDEDSASLMAHKSQVAKRHHAAITTTPEPTLPFLKDHWRYKSRQKLTPLTDCARATNTNVDIVWRSWVAKRDIVYGLEYSPLGDYYAYSYEIQPSLVSVSEEVIVWGDKLATGSSATCPKGTWLNGLFCSRDASGWQLTEASCTNIDGITEWGECFDISGFEAGADSFICPVKDGVPSAVVGFTGKEGGVPSFSSVRCCQFAHSTPGISAFCKHSAAAIDHDGLEHGWGDSFEHMDPDMVRSTSSIFYHNLEECALICLRNPECMAFVDNDNALGGDNEEHSRKYCDFKRTGNYYPKAGKTVWTLFGHGEQGEHCDHGEHGGQHGDGN